MLKHRNGLPDFKRKRGQSLAEYGFILALVVVVCIGALQLLGQNMGTMFNGLAGSIASVMTG